MAKIQDQTKRRFARWFKARRKDASLTQHALAKEIGKSVHFIRQIEAGQVDRIVLEDALSLAGAYGVPVSQIYGRFLAMSYEVDYSFAWEQVAIALLLAKKIGFIMTYVSTEVSPLPEGVTMKECFVKLSDLEIGDCFIALDLRTDKPAQYDQDHPTLATQYKICIILSRDKDGRLIYREIFTGSRHAHHVEAQHKIKVLPLDHLHVTATPRI